MNQQIAIRSDGAIAVATSIMDGWGYGYLIDANGERFEWPSPLASLLGQGSWKPIGGFDLSTITPPSEFPDAISKAYKRKYATRTEAARAAANARWGNRSGYSQGAVTSRRQVPVNAETLNSDYRSETAAKYIVDEVLTESVAPFDSASFISAVENGKPVELVGVHATDEFGSSFKFSAQPTGGGNLGTGTYASLIDPTGMLNQQHYQERGRQLLVSVSLKNPVVIRREDTRFDTFRGGEIAAITALEKKGLVTGKETRLEILDLIKKDMPPIRSADDFNPKMDLVSSYLSRTGYDGIVVIAQPSTKGFQGLGLGSQVSVFSGKQIKIIDPVLTADERQLVYAVGAGETVTKALSDAFDGRGFDLVDIEDLISEPITKMSRSEAGRYAANVRWGNRTTAIASIDAASLSRGQKITIEGKQLGNLTVNMVDTGLDGDLRNVSIPGYALFDGANMGLRREQMPQVPSRAKPQFLSEMRLKGVGVAAQSVDPRTLKPSQMDVSAALTGKIVKMMRDGSFRDSPASRILVSKDGFVIDGHHRWAAASAYAFDVPGARLPIIRVDLNAADLIPAAREFGAREGIKTLGFGETLKKAARWIFGS